MSQIVYTELEGQPLRWPYLQAVPVEGEQTADNTPKSWSVSTTPATLIQNANTGTSNPVYGANMVGQVFITPQNALKVTAVQLYGAKAGSPPNPLIVEVRDIKELVTDDNPILETSFTPVYSVSATNATTIGYNQFSQEIIYTKKFVPFRYGFIIGGGANTATFTIRTGGPGGTVIYGPIQASINSDGTNYCYIDLSDPPLLDANTSYYFTIQLSSGKALKYNSSDVIPGSWYYGSGWNQGSGDYACQVYIASEPEQVYGSRKIAMPFTTYYDIGKIEFLACRVGNPGGLIVELRGGEPDGELIAYTTIAPENIPNALSWITAVFSYSKVYHSKKTFYIVFHAAGGDTDNYYKICAGYQSDLPKIFINEGNGWTQSSDKTTFLKVYAKRIYPGETILASGQSTSIGTSAAWYSVSLSTPVALRPDTVYAIVAYTIGGDSSNRYSIQNGGTGTTPPGLLEYFITSTDAGNTWTINTATDLSFKIDGVQYTKIYEGTRTAIDIEAPAVTILGLLVMAQTSSSMEFAGFDNYTLSIPITTSSATSQTKIVVLPATAPRIRIPLETSLRWEIWAAGAGLATRAITQFNVYYNKNPVTPRDFGFTELYILRVTATEANTLVMINEHKSAMIYLQNSGDSYIAPQNFNFPARIITVLSGKPIIDMIGLV
ncbi:MAG: hypothetical protein QXT12_04895 [Nitrososphaerota archaeon]